MAKISAKRQITLPIAVCTAAGIHTGDEVKSYVDRQGVISLVKESVGAAQGILKGVSVNEALTDEASLHSTLIS